MSIEETYPIHRCIIRNDVDALNKILKDEEIKKLINTKDNHGNTPIHLALMLDRRNCILSLIRNGCDCVTRNNYGWNPSEEAVMLGDIDLVEKLSYKKFQSYFEYFSSKGGTIDKWNEILPELHFKFQLKFKSKIPFLEKIGIRDVEHFYKKGNNFRMDFGFSGMDFRGIPRLMKGSISIIILFRENGNSKCYLLDNKAKLYTELYPQPPLKIQETYCESKMNVKTMYKFYVDNSALKVKKKNNSGFGFNKNKKRTIRINGNKKYNTDIYKLKDSAFIIRKRDNEHIIGDYKSHIKTTITDLDKSRNNTTSIQDELSKTLLQDSETTIKNITNDYYKEIGSSENESDSDNDDSDIESDNDNKSSDSRQQVLLEPNNDFRKMVDKNIYSITEVDSEMSDKIIQMVICGKDEKGNTIEKEDILYIRQLLPSFFTSYLMANRLPEEQQKKLEEVYTNAVGKVDLTKNGNNDLATSIKNSKNVYNMAHNIAETYYKSATTSKTSSKTSINEPIKKERITEEEYFDPKNKESLHVGRVMEISEEKKLVKNVAKFWLTKEDAFPLNCYHIKPIIDVLCLIIFDQINIKENEKDYDREIYYNTVNYIFSQVNATKRFPLKFEIPVYASTVFQSKLLEIETEKISDDKFKIPENYTLDNTIGFRFIR